MKQSVYFSRKVSFCVYHHFREGFGVVLYGAEGEKGAVKGVNLNKTLTRKKRKGRKEKETN